MSQNSPVLHLMCGKIAAGKSTLAAQLAEAPGTVLLSEDALLATLYGDQIATPKDFVVLSGRLRAALASHIVELLGAGISVVLDFQANTVDSREWMRGLIAASGAAHQLHVLMPPDEVCLTRLRDRNASGEHPFTLTEEQFHEVSKYFVPPTEAEGFTLVEHHQAY